MVFWYKGQGIWVAFCIWRCKLMKYGPSFAPWMPALKMFSFSYQFRFYIGTYVIFGLWHKGHNHFHLWERSPSRHSKHNFFILAKWKKSILVLTEIWLHWSKQLGSKWYDRCIKKCFLDSFNTYLSITIHKSKSTYYVLVH